MTQNTPKPVSKTRGRIIFLLVIFAFAGPLLVATLFYKVDGLWAPKSFINHGELIQPVRQIEWPTLTSQESVFDTNLWRGEWLLLYVGKDRCDLYCQASLFKMKQADVVLGHRSDRLRVAYVSLDDVAESSVEALPQSYQVIPKVSASADSAVIVNTEFGEELIGRIILMDPLGNIVLVYSQEATAKGILKDIKRLMKVSKVG